MTAALGAWVARKVRARLVLDIRDIFVETMNDLVQSRIAGMALKIFDLLERWTMNRADKISVVSAGFIPYFEGRYKDPPLEVFTNGIDEIFLQDFARGKGQSGEELQIVYAGNIGDGQSLHRIVPALAKRLEGVAKFRIVGDGGRIKNLKEEVRSVGVTNVEISPPISRSEVLDLYREADILFLHLNDIPAFRRVIPSKLFEYAATGKPIIAGVAGYCAEFVDSEISNAEVFAPCDLESAMKAIDRLRHTASPRSKFIEKYNRKTIMERMARLIHEVATEPRQ